MTDFLDLDTLNDEERSALRRLILTLADSKRLMGIRYSDWLLGAPSIEAGIAASSMCQDEWGHARLLYTMLRGLGIDLVEIEHGRAASEYASVGALDEPLPDWAALVAAMTLVDGAISVALRAFSNGSFEPARSRVPKMLAEEEYHVSLAAAWYRRLAESSEEARGLLRDATMGMLPSVLGWLGADDAPARAMVAAGVTEPGESLAQDFRDRHRELVGALGIDIDDVAVAEGWDEARARAPGFPDDEAIERARGDRNRALFVE